MRASFKTLLAASATVAILAVPALADTFFFRSAEQIIDPPVSAISFAAVAGVDPGVATTSSIARIAGHRGKTASIVGGEYQVCAADDCSDQNVWRSSPTPNVPSAFFARVRTTSPAFGQTASARLSVGDATAAFEVSSRVKLTNPAAFAFTSVSNVEPNRPAYSAPIVLSGFDGAPLSVSGGGYQICDAADCSDRNGRPALTTPIPEIGAGTRLRLVATPGTFGISATATLTVGERSASFSATARAKDITPDDFNFASVSNVEPGRTAYSEPVTLSGFDGAPLSISGGGYQICSAVDCSDQNGRAPSFNAIAEVVPGTRLRLAATPQGFGNTETTTVNVGPLSRAFSATSRGRSETPTAITFAPETNITAGNYISSSIRQIINHDGVTVRVTGANAMVRSCADANCSKQISAYTTSSIIVANGEYVQIRTIAPAAGQTSVATLAYGTRSTTWSVTSARPLIVSAGDFNYRCSSWTGKRCNDAQLQVKSPSAAFSRGRNGNGTYVGNTWSRMWYPTTSAIPGLAETFCQIATGNSAVVSQERTGQMTTDYPYFITNSVCTDGVNRNQGACKSITGVGGPTNEMSFHTIGRPHYLNIECAGF